MGKRGPKPKGKVQIKWSANFAYAIGLIATDGCLSPSGRHIVFVSKDDEQIENYMLALGIANPVSSSKSTYTGGIFQEYNLEMFSFMIFYLGLGLRRQNQKP